MLVGLVGQFRPKKLISSIKAEVSAAKKVEVTLLNDTAKRFLDKSLYEIGLRSQIVSTSSSSAAKKVKLPLLKPLLKDTAKHFLDKSLYAIGLCSQIVLTSSSSLFFSSEKHGEKKSRRTKAVLFHKLPDHDVTLEAAWPELFVDHKGNYWEVPISISLDCSSLVSESGLRYRFGIHKSSGLPAPVDSVKAQAPLALSPGICAKAAFSYEKSKDRWRQMVTRENVVDKLDDEDWPPSYDIRLREPHSAISGIIGGTCEAWLQGRKDDNSGRFGADLFGSVCFTCQHGRFRNSFGDLTRLDARLDIGSASALAKRVSKIFISSQNNRSPNESTTPSMSLLFQQQVAGPVVFRVDSKFSLGGKYVLKLEDMICSLNYSLRVLGSGKVVAWYSPKRKEGMVELRLFEF
ncbi:hypothetical protein OROHE_004889 [Orobanche hederae]